MRLALRPGDRCRGMLLAGGLGVACAIGRTGIVRDKREGDGGTPAGRLRTVAGFYRADRLPRPPTGLPLRALRPDDGWCDDPASPAYNRPVRLPFARGREAMWRTDGLYDVVVVLDWNLDPALKRRGSAIFLHVAAPGLAPTAGCIAVRRSDLLRLLPRLTARTVIAIG
jgi:L,D-peptidoglycan transpeptidase YkuD (ErfK/YbiS/YcfS/YnhG family)